MKTKRRLNKNGRIKFNIFGFLQHIPRFLPRLNVYPLEVVKVEPKISRLNYTTKVFFKWRATPKWRATKSHSDENQNKTNPLQPTFEVRLFLCQDDDGKTKHLKVLTNDFRVFYPQNGFRLIMENYDFGISFQFKGFAIKSELNKYFRGIFFQVTRSSQEGDRKKNCQLFHRDFLFINEPYSSTKLNQIWSLRDFSERLELLRMVPVCELFRKDLAKRKEEMLSHDCKMIRRRFARPGSIVQKLIGNAKLPMSFLPKYNVIREDLVRKHSQNLLKPGRKNEGLRLESVHFFGDLLIPKGRRVSSIFIPLDNPAASSGVQTIPVPSKLRHLFPFNNGVDLLLLEKHNVFRNILIARLQHERDSSMDTSVFPKIGLRIIPRALRVQENESIFDQYNNFSIHLSTSKRLQIIDNYDESSKVSFFLFRVESFHLVVREILSEYFTNKPDSRGRFVVKESTTSDKKARVEYEVSLEVLERLECMERVMGKTGGGYGLIIDYFLYHSRTRRYFLMDSQFDQGMIQMLIDCLSISLSFSNWIRSSRTTERKIEDFTNSFLLGQLEQMISRIEKIRTRMETMEDSKLEESKSKLQERVLNELNKPVKFFVLNSLENYISKTRNLRSLYQSLQREMKIGGSPGSGFESNRKRCQEFLNQTLRERIVQLSPNQSSFYRSLEFIIKLLVLVHERYYYSQTSFFSTRKNMQRTKSEELILKIFPICITLLNNLTQHSPHPIKCFEMYRINVIGTIISLLTSLIGKSHKNVFDFSDVKLIVEISDCLIEILSNFIHYSDQKRELVCKRFKQTKQRFEELLSKKKKYENFEEFVTEVTLTFVDVPKSRITSPEATRYLKDIFNLFTSKKKNNKTRLKLSHSDSISFTYFQEDICSTFYGQCYHDLGNLVISINNIIRFFHSLFCKKNNHLNSRFTNPSFRKVEFPSTIRQRLYFIIPKISLADQGLKTHSSKDKDENYNLIAQLTKIKYDSCQQTDVLLRLSELRKTIKRYLMIDNEDMLQVGEKIDLWPNSIICTPGNVIYSHIVTMKNELIQNLMSEMDKNKKSSEIIRKWDYKIGRLNALSNEYFINLQNLCDQQVEKNGTIFEFVSMVLYGNRDMMTNGKRVSIEEEYMYVKRVYDEMSNEEKEEMDGSTNVKSRKFKDVQSKNDFFRFFDDEQEFKEYFVRIWRMCKLIDCFEESEVCCGSSVEFRGMENWCCLGVEYGDVKCVEFVGVDETVDKWIGLSQTSDKIVRLMDDQYMKRIAFIPLFGRLDERKNVKLDGSYRVFCKGSGASVSIELFFRDYWTKICGQQNLVFQEFCSGNEKLKNHFVRIREIYDDLNKKIQFLFNKFQIIRSRQKRAVIARKK